MTNVETGLAVIEERLDNLRELLEAHTAADAANFASLDAKLDALDDKINELMIRSAAREGEQAATRKFVSFLSAAISGTITICGLIIQHLAK